MKVSSWKTLQEEIDTYSWYFANYVQQKDYASAECIAREIIIHIKGSPSAHKISKEQLAAYHKNLGNILLLENKISEATSELEAAVHTHRSLSTLADLALAYELAKKPKSFEKTLQKIAKEDDQGLLQQQFYRSAANYFLLQSNPQEADKWISKALTRQPDNPENNYVKGMVRFTQNNINQAKSYLKKAIHLDPERAEFHYALGKVYHKYNKEGALSHLEKAVCLAPTNTEYSYDLANEYFEQEKYTFTIAQLKHVLTLDPDYRHVQARSLLAASYLKKQINKRSVKNIDIEEAILLLSKIYPNTRDPATKFLYGIALVLENRFRSSKRLSHHHRYATKINGPAIAKDAIAEDIFLYNNLKWIIKIPMSERSRRAIKNIESFGKIAIQKALITIPKTDRSIEKGDYFPSTTISAKEILKYTAYRRSNN